MNVRFQITPLGDDVRVELEQRSLYSRRLEYSILATDLQRTQENRIILGDRDELLALRNCCDILLDTPDTPKH